MQDGIFLIGKVVGNKYFVRFFVVLFIFGLLSTGQAFVLGMTKRDLYISPLAQEKPKQVLAAVITKAPTPTDIPIPTEEPTPIPTKSEKKFTPTAQPTKYISPTPVPTVVAITATPLPTQTAIGSADTTLEEILERIAQCESKSNWSIDTGNGYYGGLQFSQGAWESVGGTGNPAQASKDEQLSKGKLLQQKRGWSVWGACSKQLGLW